VAVTRRPPRGNQCLQRPARSIDCDVGFAVVDFASNVSAPRAGTSPAGFRRASGEAGENRASDLTSNLHMGIRPTVWHEPIQRKTAS
jgi:hypothetical protein